MSVTDVHQETEAERVAREAAEQAATGGLSELPEPERTPAAAQAHGLVAKAVPDGEHDSLDTSAGEMAVVKIDDLDIDHSYQRDLDPNLVQSIADNWDIVAAGPIVVARRADGSLWIVNGQHRAAGAKRAGEAEILAQVVPSQGSAHEATIRLRGNTRRSDKSQERFKAQVAAGNRESLAIVELLRNFDTQINRWNDARNGINSVSAVERLYRRDQGVLLARVLEVIRDTYGGFGGKPVTVANLNGVAWFLVKHGHEYQRDRLVEKCRAAGIDEIDRKARAHRAAMGSALWMNYYRAMVELYNDRLPEGSRLMWQGGGWTKVDPHGGGGGHHADLDRSSGGST